MKENTQESKMNKVMKPNRDVGIIVANPGRDEVLVRRDVRRVTAHQRARRFIG